MLRNLKRRFALQTVLFDLCLPHPAIFFGFYPSNESGDDVMRAEAAKF